MNKQKFLNSLQKRLSHLPRKEAEERLTFYSEMIDDRMEEGLSEEDAVAAVGTVDEIASQGSEESLGARAREKASPKAPRAAEIALLVLGSPIWLSLLIAVFAVALSLYIVLWALTLSLWALELPFFIFSFISRCLMIACRKTTLFSLFLTKTGAAAAARLFGGKGR